MNIINFGYYKLFSVSPKLKIGKALENVKEHSDAINRIQAAHPKDEAIILFPELSLSGYTCEDLFLNERIIQETLVAINKLTEFSKDLNHILVVGAPLESNGRLYNCAVVIQKGKILAVVPKTHIVNYGEFYEKRWFTSGTHVHEFIKLAGKEVLLSAQQLIKTDTLTFGIEICEDLFAPISPSCNLALNGAQLILNLSASNDLIGKDEYRKELVRNTSARLNCGYLYASAGLWESTRDLVFGGKMMYAENGTMLIESRRFSLDTEIMECEIDVQKINFERRRNKTFGDAPTLTKTLVVNSAHNLTQTLNLTRQYDPRPFTPKDETKLKERVAEILELQSSGLVRRLLSLPKQVVVLGLSGGSDSTLALLVCKKAMEKLASRGGKIIDIHAISMPGFGSSERTKDQARRLAKEIGCSFQEIDIKNTTQSHLNDIQHDKIDFVYENAQARERAQVLFDYANKVGGIVCGTSDISESFSNNSTYAGDHMASYNVNITVPKALVKYIIKHYPAEAGLRQVLDDVLNTLVSPELLPLDKQGQIQQSSEKTVGPYEIHDFVMNLFIRSGFSKEKIIFLAEKSFKESYTLAELEKWINESFRRFAQGQFKRTVSPPGVKIGSISLGIREARYPDEME